METVKMTSIRSSNTRCICSNSYPTRAWTSVVSSNIPSKCLSRSLPAKIKSLFSSQTWWPQRALPVQACLPVRGLSSDGFHRQKRTCRGFCVAHIVIPCEYPLGWDLVSKMLDGQIPCLKVNKSILEFIMVILRGYYGYISNGEFVSSKASSTLRYYLP